ncbi:MAG: AMP-binding protein [Burkholderiales bacterium]
MRLESLLAGHARRRPAQVAVVCGPVRLTYCELAARVERTAGGLHELDVRSGDRVLLVLGNTIEFIVAEYAAFRLGALAVTVNPRLAPPEIEHIVVDAQPAVAVYSDSTRALAEPGLARMPTCRRVVVGVPVANEIAYETLEVATERALPDVPLEHDDAIIMYTSGTTGRAKGALITHANMVVQSVYLHPQEWRLSAEDRFLAVNPLAHRAGAARLFNALGLGATLVVMEQFDVEAALTLIERERITVTGFVPTVLRMLLPHLRANPARCASLRRIIVSTEAFPVELKREILALLPHVEFHSLFGSTEVLVTNLNHAEQFTHPASVGRPLPGVEVRLVDEQDREVGSGEVGELVVRSGVPGRWATFRGYFNQAEATAKAIKAGWVYTGDMARADADGYLYIVDRKKDMVISGGYNIYSKEVEQTLLSLPGVTDAAVIGVPDPIYGEAVAAVIELTAGATLTVEQVIEHSRQHLASYKKPRHIAFMQALPRNSTGKVLKHELRSHAATLFESTNLRIG